MLTKEEKIERRIDQYSKAGSVIVLVSVLPDIYFKVWDHVIVTLGLGLCFVVCILVNQKFKSKYVGTLLSVAANTIAFYASVTLGDLSRAYLFYIPIFIATFLIINYKNRVELFFNIGHIILGIFLLDLIDLGFLLDKTIPLETTIIIGKFNTMLALSASIYFLLAFISEISMYEDSLLEAKILAENQNEDLQKKNDELDRLIYSISHDIKAPLSSIEGLVYITKLESTQPILNEYFDLMLTSTKRLKGFLENVLDFYKNSKFEPKAEEIDFDFEIKQILQNLKYTSKFREIEFLIDVDQKEELLIDKLRIQTILVNLLSNAIKYQNEETEHKIIVINVTTSLKGIKIEVSDNGIGIPLEIQDKIFDMFYRGTVKSDGSGLGLYILSETVKKLKGTIKLQSLPQEFTKFTIEIPAAT